MELNVKLTADELMNVVDAAMDEAIDRGYCEDDETVDDMLHIIDAALSAMGIEIVPADEDDEDEEEDNDPIADMLYVLDDGRTAISFEDACFLMDMIKETGIERHGLSDEEATEAAKTIFMQIGKDYGIDVVEEDEDEDEEEDMESIIYDVDGHRGISASDARLLMRCVADVMHKQFGYLPDEVIEILVQQETMRIANEWNIEVVDMSEDK